MLNDRELQMKINKFLNRKRSQYPDVLETQEPQGQGVNLTRLLYT